MTQMQYRLIGGAILAVSLCAFGGSMWGMSQRLDEFRTDEPLDPNYFIPLGEEAFPYLRRDVVIETRPDAAPPVVSISYGDETEVIPIVGRDVPELGGLDRHLDWLRVLLLAGEQGKQANRNRLLEEPAPGSQLVVVARGGAPGFDPETWGTAHYKDWVYTFLVLEPDGSITRFNKTYRELSKSPHTWEFATAMTVTPSLHTPAMRSSSPISYPNYSPVRDAFGSMGWTWPVAGFSMLGCVIGTMVFAGSFVSRGFEEDDEL